MAALVRGIEGRLVKAYPTHANALVMRELPAVAGDRTLLGRVLEALLDNAFKFSRATARPRIEIDARHEADRIVYVVSDNGVGFDMKFATRLFGLFQRMHSETEFEGTGVDLAIARRIVERHGGTLQGSAAREQGAMFSFSLPRLSLQR